MALAAAGLACAACAGPVGVPAGNHAHARPSVSAWLVLPSRTIAAGSSMSGRVVVDNSTGRPVPVWGCVFLFQVLLVGRVYRPEPAWLSCLQRFTIPVGESSYPVTINASYNRCSQPGGQGMPCMADGQAPPLPAGDYRAVIFAGRNLFTIRAPVPVRVTPLR